MFSNLTRRGCETPAQPKLPATSRYLTDGRNLFRRAESSGPPGYVWLEDCRSLELLLVSADDVGFLRAVAAAER